MEILVINCGSSSLKYQLVDPITEKIFAVGLCDRIGITGSKLEYKAPSMDIDLIMEIDMPTHKEALEAVIEALTSKEHGVVSTIEEIEAIGHRVVHGGERFTSSALITNEVIEGIEECNELAPLHNPANLMGIKTIQKLLPGKPNIAVFDTAFHQTMPAEAFMYPLPYSDYKELKIRKYGFHGTSHKFVSGVANEIMEKPEMSKVIVCHLGNGASISAVKDGKSIDTSMGLTPLQGLMMGTRCGDIDPAAVNFIKNKRNLTDKEMDTRMNKKSGILGIFEKSSDCRDLQEQAELGDEKAILALNMMTYKIRNYITQYAGAMGGVDMICFTGGIGENSSIVRELSLKNLEYMGVKLDTEVNSIRKKGNVMLNTEDSQVKIYKIPTNEELVIARDTLALIKE